MTLILHFFGLRWLNLFVFSHSIFIEEDILENLLYLF